MENLGIDGKLMLAQLINFVLFFYIFKRYIAKPFAKFLSQEKEKEVQKQKILAEMQQKEEDLAKKQEELKKKADKQYEEALRKAKLDAERVKSLIIAEARSEAEQIVTKRAKQIEEEKNKLYAQVKDKVLELSVFVVNKALSDFLDQDARKKITTEILKNSSKTIKI